MALVPFTYLNIHEFDKNDEKNQNKERLFYINDKVIKIKEFHEKGIGGIFWDCVSKFLFLLMNSLLFFMNILNLIKIFSKKRKY